MNRTPIIISIFIIIAIIAALTIYLVMSSKTKKEDAAKKAYDDTSGLQTYTDKGATSGGSNVYIPRDKKDDESENDYLTAIFGF